MNRNDWRQAGALFAEDFTLDWPQSGERIRGRDDFAALNAAYPATAPWHFDVRHLWTDGLHVITETEVKSGNVAAVAISFFTVRDGEIAHIREFWPEPFAAPAWRAQWVETP